MGKKSAVASNPIAETSGDAAARESVSSIGIEPEERGGPVTGIARSQVQKAFLAPVRRREAERGAPAPRPLSEVKDDRSEDRAPRRKPGRADTGA
jgi:hypothetical protein